MNPLEDQALQPAVGVSPASERCGATDLTGGLPWARFTSEVHVSVVILVVCIPSVYLVW